MLNFEVHFIEHKIKHSISSLYQGISTISTLMWVFTEMCLVNEQQLKKMTREQNNLNQEQFGFVGSD